MLDASIFQVEQAIVHDVPVRAVRGGGAVPAYSEIESELNQELRNYFREKIAGSLAAQAFEVVFDTASSSPVPELVEALLGVPPVDIVAPSQGVAQHLHAVQTGVNPAGLLTLIGGTVKTRPAIAIMKLEREDGLRVRQTRRDGRKTFDMQTLHDLMLTQKTKVFKVGLFTRTADGQPIEGLVTDKQRGYEPKTEVADFFMRFLGCSLKEAPNVVTKRLFVATEEFINERVPNPEDKAKYQIALMAELGNQSAEFKPREFAERHLDVSHRQPFIETLGVHQVPQVVVRKDTKLVQAHLSKLQFNFKSGVTVIAPTEGFDDHVSVEELDGGLTRLAVTDTLDDVHGRR